MRLRGGVVNARGDDARSASRFPSLSRFVLSAGRSLNVDRSSSVIQVLNDLLFSLKRLCVSLLGPRRLSSWLPVELTALGATCFLVARAVPPPWIAVAAVAGVLALIGAAATGGAALTAARRRGVTVGLSAYALCGLAWVALWNTSLVVRGHDYLPTIDSPLAVLGIASSWPWHVFQRLFS